MILITGSRLRWDEAAALPGREEEIVETAVFVQIRALDGMVSSRFIRKVVRIRNRLFGSRIHPDLVDASPERAKGHVKGAAVIEEIGIDGIVVVGRRGFNARRAMVRPGSVSHRVGRRQANGRVLGARGGHGIVQVIDPIDIPEIGCLADANRISMEGFVPINFTSLMHIISMHIILPCMAGIKVMDRNIAHRPQIVEHTQRSFLPGLSIEEPSGTTEPTSVHGPCRASDRREEILLNVEKRK